MYKIDNIRKNLLYHNVLIKPVKFLEVIEEDSENIVFKRYNEYFV